MKQRTELKRITGLKRSTKPIKRTTELKRGTRDLTRTAFTRRKTKKLRDYDAEFEKMRPLVLARSGGRCESRRFLDRVLSLEGTITHGDLMVMEDMILSCTGNAVHVHHRKYRKRGGTNGLSNLLHTCGNCHDWIHAHGHQSNLLGLSLHAEESEGLCSP